MKTAIMPRTTRSTKVNVMEDCVLVDPEICSSEDATSPRQPLCEISNHKDVVSAEDAMLQDQLKGLKAAYKMAIGLKKAKKSKKGKKWQQTPVVPEAGEEERPGLIRATNLIPMANEDDRRPPSETPTSGTEIVTKTYRVPGTAITSERASNCVTSDGDITTENALPSYQHATPRAMIFASKRSEPSEAEAKSLVADMSIQTTPAVGRTTRAATAKAVVQTPVKEPPGMPQRIADTSTTPMKANAMTLEEIERTCVKNKVAHLEDDEDSFVEQITSRSPAKPVLSGIEDYVSAMDELEETIDALDEVAQAHHMASPARRKFAPARAKNTSPIRQPPLEPQLSADKPKFKGSSLNGKTQGATVGSLRVKAKPSGGSLATKSVMATSEAKQSLQTATSISKVSQASTAEKKPHPRPVSLLPPKPAVRAVKPPTLPKFELPGEAVSRRLKEQREARLALRQMAASEASTPRVPPVKTKPTTAVTSKFSLPGEALSLRKREAHEARLRAQEEEEKNRREFKAKPVKASLHSATLPRETAASLARRSLVVTEQRSLTVAKRSSTIGSHRPSMAISSQANVSAPRARPRAPLTEATFRKSSTTNGPSMTGLSTARVSSAADAQAQRQRAKDIYMREARYLEDVERERKEREAAAKRSREEAAERGRQASREWAERQRAKKAAVGDKGLSAGYGPGGQLGLKG